MGLKTPDYSLFKKSAIIKDLIMFLFLLQDYDSYNLFLKSSCQKTINLSANDLFLKKLITLKQIDFAILEK